MRNHAIANDSDDSIDTDNKNEISKNTLNLSLQLGDVVEYRLSSKSSIPKKGKIVSIGVLTSDRVVQVSDGTWLSKSLHDVKRIEVVRSDGVTMVMNPNPRWVSLSKMVIVSFVEDCYSDDEDDDCGEDTEEMEWVDGDTTPTTMFETRAAAEQPNPNQLDIDDGASVDDVGRDTDEQQTLRTNRSTKNKHERTSCGVTGHSFNSQTRRNKERQEKLDRRRRTEDYLPWAHNRDNSAVYTRAMKIVNKLYRQCLR